MNDLEKLRVLIPHWIEHNNEHVSELLDWAELAGKASHEIHTAAEGLLAANKALTKAVEKLGGPLEHYHSEG